MIEVGGETNTDQLYFVLYINFGIGRDSGCFALFYQKYVMNFSIYDTNAHWLTFNERRRHVCREHEH